MSKELKRGSFRLEIIALLILAVSFIAFGAWRGEASVVLEKGINLCLECVGIG